MIRVDEAYHFASIFRPETGFYLRTGVLDERGRDTGKDPFMASFPHLIDVGIMGSCKHGTLGLCEAAGVGCYQSGKWVRESNMPLDDFRWIAAQCKGRVHQFALGGRGDPDQHESFREILEVCRENGIVPNFTTSGLGMTDEIAALCSSMCGAVAVSWYRSSYTEKAIRLLLANGVKTNIHYVLGRSSIDEAIARLRHNDFPGMINAVIFLLHKPVGQGSRDNLLSLHDPKTAAFFEALEQDHPFRVGLDSCSVPGALNFSTKILQASLDTCEGGRFSCYISPSLEMLPCSFDQDKRYAIQLNPLTIQEAWNSAQFDAFRSHLRHSCPDCADRDQCMGGCPLRPDIVLCNRCARTTHLNQDGETACVAC